MSTITFTHIGGPTTLIEVEGWRILTDPTFDAPGRTYKFGWGTSSRKTTGPAIPASEISNAIAGGGSCSRALSLSNMKSLPWTQRHRDTECSGMAFLCVSVPLCQNRSLNLQ